MSIDKRIELVEKVLRQSRMGRVDWEETVNSNQFIVTKGNLSILISQTEGPQGNLIIIKILNEDGDVIEVFNDETWGSSNSNWEMFQELYTLARRYAMGTEQALDQLLNSFDDVPF